MQKRNFMLVIPLVAACYSESGTVVPLPVETDNPTIPVGYDAYRMWERWPYLRLGTRAYLESTYDRSGGNEGSDASHYLRIDASGAAALDVVGPGVLYFARANRWHGSPWNYVVDGADDVFQESDTADPNAATPGSTFDPSGPLADPLALTWSTTQGSDLIGVPISFAQSLEIADTRTHYGTGYYVFDRFPIGARNLSQAVSGWSPSAPPPDVVALLNRAGSDLSPTTANVTSLGGSFALPSGSDAVVFDATGPATMRALTFTVSAADAAAFGASTLRVTWDGRAAPSIDAPLALFFGTGSLENRNDAEYLVKAFPVSVHFENGMVTFAAYFPMPFFASAHVEIIGGAASVANVTWSAKTIPYEDPPNWVGYFHATFADQGVPIAGRDLTLLDTTQVEGGGDWCGSFVGTSFTFSDRAVLTTLEGDPRFFFDDSQTPQGQGTGTEEWGGGGDYWNGGQITTLPFYGHPVGAPDAAHAANAEDLVESAYRFLLADLMPFGKNARIQLEHGGVDDSVEHYRTLAYWYGLPGACLVQTDSLHVGDANDEAAHDYQSPDASTIDTLTTRYEWGVDQLDGNEIFPATTDTGRHTTGTSELTLSILSKNFGVMLRRKLDYGFPDQRAEVFVADASGGELGDFVDAGAWYLAGSNQSVYSNPPGELDPIAPTLEASNRRWRDDEFLVPRALTDGRSKIRIRLVFKPIGASLVPGASPLQEAWSEFRYAAYSWSLPPIP